jgi:nitrous oxidase accessory protein NosD
MLIKLKKILGILVIALFALSCLYSIGFASAKKSDSINVYSGQSTIQAAVNAANSGDTIVVNEGTYQEMVSVNKPLTLIGKNAIIETPDLYGFVVSAKVTISGFQIKPLEDGLTHHLGILLGTSSDGSSASDNKILPGFLYAGIEAVSCSDISLKDNYITSGYGCNGIFIVDVSNVVVSGNAIQNSFDHGRGMDISNTENILVEDNKVSTIDIGIHFSPGDTNGLVIGNDVSMRENVIDGAHYGTYGIVFNTVSNCVARDNVVRGAKATSIWVMWSQEITVEKNVITPESTGASCGVAFNDVSDSLIKNNDISGLFYYGIALADPSHDNTVFQNTIKISVDNAGAGIWLSPDTYGNLVKNNKISGGYVAIQDDSLLNTIKH